MDIQKFIDFSSKHGIIYSVIVNLKNHTLVSFGWSYKLPYAGLLDLFHDEESIKSLNDSLEGEIMPQAMRQGEVKCLICKPQNDMLVGLFYLENRDVAEAYKFGEQLNEELSELLK